MPEKNILVTELQQFGLNQYEAIAYLSLLSQWPINGYALSKLSGIPRSRIYDVLNSLLRKQVVFEKIEDDNILYTPLEPEMLINKLKNNFLTTINHLEKETTKLYAQKHDNYATKIITGRDNIIEFIQLCLKKAKFRVDISLWQTEYNDLNASFKHLKANNIIIKGIIFGQEYELDQVITHRNLQDYLSEKEERYIIVVIDHQEAITGIVSRKDNSQVTWTNDYGVIDIVEDYIVHDLMINEYANSLQEADKNIYEKKMEIIRKKYYKNQ